MHKYLFFFNPVSGNQDPAETERTIREFCTTHKLVYHLLKTKKDMNCERVVSRYINKGYNVIVAVGGDGTISDIVNAIYGTETVAGIVPTGSSNSLAREMGIPLTLPEACKLLLTPKNTYLSDVMKVKDRLFILDISVGLNALTMKTTKRSEKRMLGIFAYIKNALKNMLGFRPQYFTITVDGTAYQFRGSEVLIANGGILKNLLARVIPDASWRDRIMDIIVVKTRRFSDYLKIIWYLILNKKTHDSRVHKLNAKKTVTVDARKKVPVQGDGEDLGYTPVTVSLIPGAIPIITVPKKRS